MYPNYPNSNQQQSYGQPGAAPLGFEGNYGGYPQQPNSGYPPYPSGGAGYPPSAAYPSGGYPQPYTPASQPGYPAPMTGYPPLSQQSDGYPPVSQQTGGYPPASQQPGGYPPASQQPGGYPPYQQPTIYPPQHQSASSGHPPATAGYPPQQQPAYQFGYTSGAPTVAPYQQQQPSYQSPTNSNSGMLSHQGGTNYPSSHTTMALSTQGTIRPFPGFNANGDAEVLKKAMKGFGCNDAAVMNVLCYRSASQRLQVRHAFKTMYGQDLIKELISELKGNFEDLIVALLLAPDEYDAQSLRKAMEGAGTNESTLIEILCTRTNQEIRAIRDTYRRLYHRELEADIQSETSGHFKRLLVSMCQAGRDESTNMDPGRASVDAQRLYQAGEKVWGTDEAMFNAILCSQNAAQLRLVFSEYQKIAKHDIDVAIRKEFSGDVESGLMAVVKTMKNRPAYFAERLYYAMKGMGTNDTQLIRVVVTRCEIDMVQIKQEFQKAYGKTLEAMIASDTSGKYKEGLMALVRGN